MFGWYFLMAIILGAYWGSKNSTDRFPGMNGFIGGMYGAGCFLWLVLAYKFFTN